MKLLKKVLSIAIFLAIPLYASAQNITVTGVVSDNTGEGAIGASVIQQGTNNGVITDLDGKYTIFVPANATLVFSSIGFKDQVVPVNGKTKIDVTLQEDNELLEEVVVVGYGVQKKSDVTGAIASVDEKSFGNRSVDNVAAAFAGKTSGVQIIADSGDPSSIGKIRIRGVSSNDSGASDPLYIVDGLQVSDLSSVDPQNVKSIEILKDAASAAIYGAQAGNGVVVITTKTGEKTEKGVGQIFYNGSYTIQRIGTVPKMMNAAQYKEYQIGLGYLSESTFNQYWDGKTDFDWVKGLFPGGWAQRHQIGFRGANDRASLYTSISYSKNNGILYGDSDVMDRLNFQLNADYKIKDWLKIGTTNTFQVRKSSDRIGGYAGGDGSVLAYAVALDPCTPMSYPANKLPEWMQYDLDRGMELLTLPNGEYLAPSMFSAQVRNPLISIYRYKDSLRRNIDLNGTLFLNLTPFKGFTFTSRLGYRVGASDTSNYQEPWYSTPTELSTTYSLSAQTRWSLWYQWENFINYTHTFAKKHRLDAMAGMSFIQGQSTYTSGETNTLSGYAPNFRYLDYSTADALDTIKGNRSRSASLSYFARLGYSFDNRYYIQASFRADAFDSSKLDPSNRWGYFPSVSAGWTVTNEPWMKNVSKDALSFLKLRASWGINGNVNVLSGYQYASTIAVGASVYQMENSSAFTLASYPNKLANPGLSWERAMQYDLGLDARFLRDRLTLGLDLYLKNTNDLLVNITPSFTTGQSSVYLNSGSVQNKGIEVDLGWKDSIGDFSYSISGNLSHNKNKATYLDSQIAYIAGTEINNSHTATRFQVGYPVWGYWGYKFDHFDSETGEAIVKDVSGDGKIDENDMDYLGSSQPVLSYGLTISLEWKGIDFTIFGSGNIGNKIWFTALRTSQIRNVPAALYTQSWTKDRQNAKFPSFEHALDNYWVEGDGMIYDGSYLRINQIQLGYTLPKKWLDAVKFSNIRVYASLDDFFTFTNYFGFDPAVAGDGNGKGRGLDRGAYPTPKRVMFGLNLSF